jgi:hypothetical protein
MIRTLGLFILFLLGWALLLHGLFIGLSWFGRLNAQRIVEQMIFASPTGSGDFWVTELVWLGVYAPIFALLSVLALRTLGRKQ